MSAIVNVTLFVFIAAAGGVALASIVGLVASVIDIALDNLLSPIRVLPWLTGTTRRWVTLLVVCSLVAAVFAIVTWAH